MRKMFEKVGPQLAKPESGREPSLSEIILHYYTSHGIDTQTAEKLRDDYVQSFSEHEVYCPSCGEPAKETDTGNGGTLWVGEDDECFDPNIKYFKCTDKGCRRHFYLSIDDDDGEE